MPFGYNREVATRIQRWIAAVSIRPEERRLPGQWVLFDTVFTRLLIAFRTGEEETYGYFVGGLSHRFFPRIGVVHHCAGSSLEVRL